MRRKIGPADSGRCLGWRGNPLPPDLDRPRLGLPWSPITNLSHCRQRRVQPGPRLPESRLGWPRRKANLRHGSSGPDWREERSAAGVVDGVPPPGFESVVWNNPPLTRCVSD